MGITVIDAAMDADVAGAIRREAGANAVIYLNHSDNVRRRRFTCAHEIGHFKDYEIRGLSEIDSVDFRAGAASAGVRRDEIFANSFAAALLMPEAQVRELRAGGLSDEELASEFGVSVAAMVNRLKNLDLYGNARAFA